MNPPRNRITAHVVLLAATAWSTAAFAETGSVAGLAPDRRPTGAPQITTNAPIDRARALHGVSEPIPASLKFLDDQGGWFTPFVHPGMPEPYDLRGWHANPSARKK